MSHGFARVGCGQCEGSDVCRGRRSVVWFRPSWVISGRPRHRKPLGAGIVSGYCAGTSSCSGGTRNSYAHDAGDSAVAPGVDAGGGVRVYAAESPGAAGEERGSPGRAGAFDHGRFETQSAIRLGCRQRGCGRARGRHQFPSGVHLGDERENGACVEAPPRPTSLVRNAN